ncbi:NAD-dependent protein deacylase [Corynebacterium sp. HMSC30G07]|uniref:NAD-dependent deacylase n=1 Tax=Corynebacterium sp. HMSC30G07 TaxID=1581072 RepID=UPI0008A3E620|nr:NAD-dependent deacylase [Corynebacterium sp. HMSC30G07]OFT74128.1 NAD-dependent protein deacylase [Corynebacterium sp. HMSC30G07]
MSQSGNLAQSLAQARDILSHAKHIEVFTGAGMSADSGIATYRDAQTGLWENVDPQAMASINAWHRDADTMFAWYLWRAHLAQQAQPNAGHLAIANCPKTTVTTQNIDNLHERAGSQNVVHLHGSLFDFRCTDCDEPYTAEIALPHEPVPTITPPTCPTCGGLIRPGVVWFGEALPEAEWHEAERRMRTADALLIVGTSGVVYPAAGLPLMAHAREIPIIEVTPMRTDLSHLATVVVEDTAANALPKLLG